MNIIKSFLPSKSIEFLICLATLQAGGPECSSAAMNAHKVCRLTLTAPSTCRRRPGHSRLADYREGLASM